MIYLTAFCLLFQVPRELPPVLGRPMSHTVARGETLASIARSQDTGIAELMRLNGLTSSRVKPGASLRLPSDFIPPAAPKEGIVLNIAERAVYVFRLGKPPVRHAVAVGKLGWETATGEYHLARKTKNPTWHPPKSMVEAGEIKDEPVPPGPHNPLGDRWMGWSLHGFGFHSTNAPRSIGYARSHGCVRLYPERAKEMFDEVKVGMPIVSVYEPAVIGQRDGIFYLSVFPDVYRRGGASLAAITARLEKLGLLPLVDAHELKRIVAGERGYPEPIVGRPERLMVGGKDVERTAAPALVRGVWYVPVREIAQALGGSVVADKESVVVTHAGHSLIFAPGRKDAGLDGKPIAIPGPITTVQGTLMAPLEPLRELFGFKVDWQKGKALAITL